MSQQQPAFQVRDEDQLSLDLIEAQYTLKDSAGKNNGKSLVVLVSGIELAGKGEAVKTLRGWMDPRFLKVKADAPSLLSATQPFWQPYARFLPSEGQICVLFDNWYSDLLASAMHVSQNMNEDQFDQYVARMHAFEQDLKNNHVDVIKIWFDLPWKELQKRLDAMDASEQHWHKLHGLDWRNQKQYDTLQRLRHRFTDDWYIIDGADETQRDQFFAQYILQHLQDLPEHPIRPNSAWQKAKIPAALRQPDNTAVEPEDYKKRLKKLSQKVADALRYDHRKVVVVLEGMDAAGKGGAIKRIVKRLDPREYDIHTIAAPESFELRYPYLWRFWNRLPDGSSITIFDRSWYGRVLVERVESFASPVAWQRAYAEINRFEQDLVDSQTVVIKLWLSISKDEQALRFKAREQTPHKRFKITADDWRNRDKWNAYLQAAADMFAQTNTDYAPWYIIATDNKYAARIAVLEAMLKQLKMPVDGDD